MNPFTYLWNLLFSTFPTQAPLPPHTRKKRHIVPTTFSCKKWTHVDEDILMDMWEDDAPVEWLANYFERSESSIKSRLIKLGYSTKQSAPRIRLL